MAGLVAFFQAFPNSGCFAPSFSKEALGILWDFNGLQASQTLNEVSPNFSSPRLPSAPSPPPPPRRKREDVPLFAGGWLQEGRGAFMVA
jgi:hypothetical protein